MSNQTSMGPTKVCVQVSAVIGLSLALTALAEPPSGDGERQHAAGRHLPISIEQAQSRALAKFTEADSDSDGQLTPEEFDSAKFPKRRGHRLHHHQEHDGPVTDAMPVDGDRHAAFEAELFDELDQDGDGALSRQEANRESHHAARRKLIKQRMFTHLDTDEDGLISQDEFSARLARLKQLDQNSDGEISRDEFRNTMRARHKAG